VRLCWAGILFWLAGSALALTPEAREFLDISRQLEPLQCEKRKLRLEIVQAEVENRAGDARALKQRFEALDRNPKTSRLEKRLAVLEARLLDSEGKPRHAEDLEAISFQHRQAFYRCE
jgi:hypothetical protein